MSAVGEIQVVIESPNVKLSHENIEASMTLHPDRLTELVIGTKRYAVCSIQSA
jgi:hypothetical protein